jgi:misacylated tRNA(Ala) deacylase
MTSTLELFRENGYLRSCDAKVTGINNKRLLLDQTVFYPEGGGQLGDMGTLFCADGRRILIENTYKDTESDRLYHVLGEEAVPPIVGEAVTLELDWRRRYRLMRMHSCMHMLCAIIPAPVTGGSIQDGRGRLDFDVPDPIDRIELTRKLQQLIDLDRPMSLSWITDEEMLRKPELVRTMSVQPPVGDGLVRLVHFDGIDLQPCGGTHVASSGEIGKVRIRKIEKKGKRNRRIIVEFDDG